MGQPKAVLKLGGETLLARQLRLLSSVCGSVGVVGWPPASSGAPSPAEQVSGSTFASRLRLGEGIRVLGDRVPGRGPLGGIDSGLQSTRTEFNLFLACDLPFITASFLRYLCQRALATTADVTVPESRQHGFEPLCAVYRRRVRWAVRGSLQSGQNRVGGIFSRLRCELVSEREMRRAGFSPSMFDNINTPAEYEAALQRCAVAL
jgi:molybdopterin-guanine dinucleotide biosynthesis protein A